MDEESLYFVIKLCNLFPEAFAGISFGKDDMVIRRQNGRNETRDQVKDFERQYMDGLITQGEKYNKVVDDVKMFRFSRRRKDG